MYSIYFLKSLKNSKYYVGVTNKKPIIRLKKKKIIKMVLENKLKTQSLN
ncbi:MAG: hypothetical protein PHY40_01950 [Patescibacteria group bacterium]|nr:hypothetical protein [Patescibacteria group bacterium]